MTHTQRVMRSLTRTYNLEDEVERWVNDDTALVDYWLRRSEDVWAIIRRLVFAWDIGEGLGIELADELQDLVTLRLSEIATPKHVRRKLRKVNWQQLAEQYALEFVGISEADLSLRRSRRLHMEG